MKNNTIICILIISVFSVDSFAQKEKNSSADKKTKTMQKPQAVRTLKSYHIEENIKMNFGGYTTTYNVSDSSLINTNDLGPNNTRVITPKFTEAEQVMGHLKETITDLKKPNFKPSDLKPTDSLKKQARYASIIMIKTYERVVAT